MRLDNTEDYINGILAKDRRILSKTITLVESVKPEHQLLSHGIVDKLLPYSGNAIRLGVTGVPGVGKSQFIESLGMFLTEQGLSIGILAVDPSSKKSGGSILADKTRMEKLCSQKNAFIRPSPSGGTLGGVASKTREAMVICEAFGFDVIIVETVGVGQSETLVASMVDFFLVLMLAGAGDELQGIKKGVLELADAIAVNKADGHNVEAALQAQKTYQNALHLLSPASPNWLPPVLTCSGLNSTGISDVWDTILTHQKKLSEAGELETKRRKQNLEWMWILVEEGLKHRFYQNKRIKAALPKTLQSVENGALAPNRAAQDLLFLLDNDGTI